MSRRFHLLESDGSDDGNVEVSWKETKKTIEDTERESVVAWMKKRWKPLLVVVLVLISAIAVTIVVVGRNDANGGIRYLSSSSIL